MITTARILHTMRKMSSERIRLFQVFKHNFIKGDEKTCLNLLNSVVITQSMVKRYFGDDDPIDKSLLIDGELWKVTAVIEDVPENTHLKFDVLLSGLSKARAGRKKMVVKSSLRPSGIRMCICTYSCLKIMIRRISTRSSRPSSTNTINPSVTKWVGNTHRSFIPLLTFIFIRTLK